MKENHRKRKYLATEKSKIITEPDNETCKNNLAQSLTSKQKQTNQNQFIIATARQMVIGEMGWCRPFGRLVGSTFPPHTHSSLGFLIFLFDKFTI